jgi:type IV pilus assembly protein PilW
MLTDYGFAAPRRGVRGASIVELLVGLAVGLFVVAGGLMMFATFTNENRQMLQETRVAQDLRAVADLLARDLRRAGYSNVATASVWTPGMSGLPPQNAYTLMAGAACDGATLNQKTTTASSSAVCYAISQDTNNTVESAERFGFEVDGGVVYFVLGGNRSALSDPKSIVITDLVITPSSQVLSAANYCSKTCTTNCPEVVVREFEILIKGHLPGQAETNRFLRSNVRVRNDFVSGQCPT